jgi:hypothetical protein
MEGHLARDGDAARVRAKVIGAVAKAERRGEIEQPAARPAVKEPFGVGIVGNAFAEIEPGGRGMFVA